MPSRQGPNRRPQPACRSVPGRLRMHPAFFPALVDDEMLDRLDAHRIVVDVQRARRFARRRAHPAGELGKIVGRVQDIECLAPLVPVHQVVPVGNDVVHRASGLAERNAAIHAARTLLRRFVVLERENEFAIAAHALLDRERDFRDAFQLHETGDLAHATRPAFGSPMPAALAAACATCISPSARLYSFGNTFTNRPRIVSQWSSIASARVLPVKRR